MKDIQVVGKGWTFFRKVEGVKSLGSNGMIRIEIPSLFSFEESKKIHNIAHAQCLYTIQPLDKLHYKFSF